MAYRFRQHHTTSTTADPDEVLLLGEWGVETDTGKAKIGDGVTTWGDLPYSALTPDEVAALYVPLSDPFLSLGLGPITSDPATCSIGGLNANRAVYMRCMGSGTITKIGLQIQTQAGNICVGVYANSGSGRSSVPGARQATSGSVACPASGYAEVSLGGSVTVNHGDWLALVADDGAASFVITHSNLLAGALWAGRSAYQDGAFPLPATASSTAGSIKSPILIGIA